HPRPSRLTTRQSPARVRCRTVGLVVACPGGVRVVCGASLRNPRRLPTRRLNSCSRAGPGSSAPPTCDRLGGGSRWLIVAACVNHNNVFPLTQPEFPEDLDN